MKYYKAFLNERSAILLLVFLLSVLATILTGCTSKKEFIPSDYVSEVEFNIIEDDISFYDANLNINIDKWDEFDNAEKAKIALYCIKVAGKDENSKLNQIDVHGQTNDGLLPFYWKEYENSTTIFIYKYTNGNQNSEITEYEITKADFDYINIQKDKSRIDVSNAESSIETNVESKIEDTKTLGYSADEIAFAIWGEQVDHYTGESNSSVIDGYQKDGCRLFFVYDAGEEYPSLMLVDIIETGLDREELFTNVKEKVSALDLPSNVKFERESFKKSPYDWDAFYLCNTDSTSYAEFDPYNTLVEPEVDYLKTISKDEYDSIYKQGRYMELWQSVESYISDNSPASYDTAYLIESTLKPMIDIWDQLEVEYDSVDNVATIYSNGINSITDTVHAVAHTKEYGNTINVIWGFYNSEWIFFDKIKIDTDGEAINIFASNANEEVLDDGNIKECIDLKLDDKELEKLSGGENVRFSSSNGKYLDFTLSTEEVNAMKNIKIVACAVNKLCNYKFMYDHQFITMKNA
ncbi:MAG: hypothetical protein SPH90_08570 [Candidatus Alectryocaccobium sp.]|nr:hypothetical protein [Candidatus Alectryocaccobium sp.]